MKNLRNVLKFEYLTCVKNKAFIITTVFLVVLVLVISAVPSIILAVQSDKEDGNNDEPSKILINCGSYQEDLTKTEFLQGYGKGYELTFTKDNAETIAEALKNDDKISFGLVIDDPLSYHYITRTTSVYGADDQIIGGIIRQMYILSGMAEHGISFQEANQLLNAPVKGEVIVTDTDQSKSFFMVYILMCILFVAIVSYGQFVAQSVVSEKNTRAMELLITCAKPTDLMFGKVIGSGLAGLTQMSIILLSTVAAFGSISSNALKQSGMPEELFSIFQISPYTAIMALVFFLTGYFTFAFLLGALASFASKSEDLNSLISPVVMTLTLIYTVLIFLSVSDQYNSSIMVFLSYFPLSAPMAMFIRASMGLAPVWEVAISVVIQLITVILLGMLAAAIYRIGVLMYGNPPKLPEIFKMLSMERKSNRKIKAGTK